MAEGRFRRLAKKQRDLQEEVKESTNKHRQDPELAAIWETLVRIEPNAKFLFNKKKTWQGNYKEAT